MMAQIRVILVDLQFQDICRRQTWQELISVPTEFSKQSSSYKIEVYFCPLGQSGQPQFIQAFTLPLERCEISVRSGKVIVGYCTEFQLYILCQENCTSYSVSQISLWLKVYISATTLRILMYSWYSMTGNLVFIRLKI